MGFARVLEPEWLDELPASDPRAVASRRDLKRLNRIMAQARVMARLFLGNAAVPPRTIIELGSGDGTFMLAVARKLAKSWTGVTVLLLDRQDIVTAQTRTAYRALGWNVETVTADVFDVFAPNGAGHCDAICANLFLHHLSNAQLTELFARASARTHLFVACEPRRNLLSLVASRLVWAVGCNDVTRHDAFASVRAGFSGDDLSRLWPARSHWRLDERNVFPFTHGFAARKIS